jgi:hypothetical protein
MQGSAKNGALLMKQTAHRSVAISRCARLEFSRLHEVAIASAAHARGPLGQYDASVDERFEQSGFSGGRCPTAAGQRLCAGSIIRGRRSPRSLSAQVPNDREDLGWATHSTGWVNCQYRTRIVDVPCAGRSYLGVSCACNARDSHTTLQQGRGADATVVVVGVS